MQDNIPKVKDEQKEEIKLLTSGKTVKAMPRKMVKETKLPNLTQMEKQVKESVVGQDEAVKRVLLAIYRSLKIRTIKTNMLIIGASGSGKTETMKQIAKMLGVPYTIEDATKYTKEGYHGEDVESMVANLYQSVQKTWIMNQNKRVNVTTTRNKKMPFYKTIKDTEKGMIIIDEIDKKCNSDSESNSGNDVSGKVVFNSLLKIMEGSKVCVNKDWVEKEQDFPIYVDTSKMLIILMGAFEGIDKIREKRLRKKQNIGFSGVSEKKEEIQDSRYTKEDLIEYGLPVEFAGRIDTIVEYKKLSIESLEKIARESKLSAFRKYEKYFAEQGIVLEYQEDIFKEIAKKASSTKTGARELSNVANEIFEPILAEIFSNPDANYTHCILKPDFVQNPKSYELK